MKQERECWLAVNRNGFIGLYTKMPVRNEKTGKWEGELYCDSVVYKIMEDLVAKANVTWENDPEYFSFGND